MAKRIVRPPMGRPPVRPPQPVDQVKAMTESLRDYLTASDRRDVESLAEVGRRLAELRAAIPHGEWGKWVNRELPFTARSAEMSIQVYRFYQTQPQLFDRIAPLGRSKLYLLMRLPPKRLRDLLDTPFFRLANGVDKPLARMTFNELKSVVAVNGPDPGERLAKTFRRQTRAIVRSVALLIQQPSIVSRDLLEDAYDKLEHALARMASVFALDVE